MQMIVDFSQNMAVIVYIIQYKIKQIKQIKYMSWNHIQVSSSTNIVFQFFQSRIIVFQASVTWQREYLCSKQVMSCHLSEGCNIITRIVNSMNGIKLQIERIIQQINEVLVKPLKPPSQHMFDLNYYSYNSKSLHISLMILEYFQMDNQLRKAYERLVKKMKEAAKYRPEEETEDEGQLGGKDQITAFLNTRKPIVQSKDRGELYKFLAARQQKQKDHKSFLENINKIKVVPIGQKNKNVQKSNQQTQTQIAWVKQIKYLSVKGESSQSYQKQIKQQVSRIEYQQRQKSKTKQESLMAKDKAEKKQKKKIGIIQRSFEGKTNKKISPTQKIEESFQQDVQSEPKTIKTDNSLNKSKNSLSKHKIKPKTKKYDGKQSSLNKSSFKVGQQNSKSEQKKKFNGQTTSVFQTRKSISINECQTQQDFNKYSQDSISQKEKQQQNIQQKIQKLNSQIQKPFNRATASFDKLKIKPNQIQNDAKSSNQKQNDGGIESQGSPIKRQKHQKEQINKNQEQVIQQNGAQKRVKPRIKQRNGELSNQFSTIYQENTEIQLQRTQSLEQGRVRHSYRPIKKGLQDLNQSKIENKQRSNTNDSYQNDPKGIKKYLSHHNESMNRQKSKQNLPLISQNIPGQKRTAVLQKIGRSKPNGKNMNSSLYSSMSRMQNSNYSLYQSNITEKSSINGLKQRVNFLMEKNTIQRQQLKKNDEQVIEALQNIRKNWFHQKSQDEYIKLNRKQMIEVRECVRIMETVHQRACGKNCRHLDRFYSLLKAYKIQHRKFLKLPTYNIGNTQAP